VKGSSGAKFPFSDFRDSTAGRQAYVRYLAAPHINEDLGPGLAGLIRLQFWMYGKTQTWRLCAALLWHQEERDWAMVQYATAWKPAHRCYLCSSPRLV